MTTGRAGHPGRTRTERGALVAESEPSPQPALFLVMEASRPLAPPGRWRLDGVKHLAVGRAPARSTRADDRGGALRLSVGVPDEFMSSNHATLHREDAAWVLEDGGSKNGTLVNGERVTRATLRDGDLVELGRTLFLYRDTRALLPEDLRSVDAAHPLPGAPLLATMVPELQRTFASLAAAASRDVSVMISGETGTGKEVVARSVHALSRRRGEFVALNCAGVPGALFESELFGYRRGAFTGATEDRPGLVRAADGGTLFLDEIGDLPMPVQGALLRVLQERTVLPFGATKPVAVDVRVISATHRPLLQLVEQGKFRADLFARLDGVRVSLPPLRERREDISLLIGAQLTGFDGQRAARVTMEPDAARALLRYGYPRNVRELHTIMLAALSTAGDSIRAAHLPSEVTQAMPARPASPPVDDELARRLHELLGKHDGNVSAVARDMGKDRRQILRWLQQKRIDPEPYRR